MSLLLLTCALFLLQLFFSLEGAAISGAVSVCGVLWQVSHLHGVGGGGPSGSEIRLMWGSREPMKGSGVPHMPMATLCVCLGTRVGVWSLVQHMCLPLQVSTMAEMKSYSQAVTGVRV